MYAIVEAGSKQYRVAKGDVVEIERIIGKVGKEVGLDKVLMYASGKTVELGKPYIKGAKVICEVVGHPRGRKVVTFKYKRRKSFRKTIGHRQELTRVKVTKIETPKN